MVRTLSVYKVHTFTTLIDVCKTDLFSGVWICADCGVEICGDCYVDVCRDPDEVMCDNLNLIPFLKCEKSGIGLELCSSVYDRI